MKIFMTMRANYFNLLLVLLMGVLPIQLQASESDKNVILYTPYTKIAVPPGESVNYSIDVINNYDVVKNVNFIRERTATRLELRTERPARGPSVNLRSYPTTKRTFR